MFEHDSLLQENDVDVLLKILEPTHPQTILEIGTWRGYSSKMWWDAFCPKMLVTVEKETPKKLPQPVYENRSIHFLWGRDSNDPKTITEIEALTKSEVDFLFIDGGHDEKTVNTDWLMYFPMVRKGGIAVLHDVVEHRSDMDVWKLWTGLKQSFPYIEIQSVRESSGMGLIFL